ncbi:MAG: nitrous oxide reductase family maturation protein NosD [Ignavibacteria bacterium]
MGKISKTFTLLLVLLFLMSLVQLQPATVKAESKTIIVPDDFSSIATAIGNATDGDTIFIKNGVYQENAIALTKNISIKGESYHSTIINVNSSSHVIVIDVLGHTATFYDPAITINTNNIALSGLTIKSNGGDISVNGNNIQITANNIEAKFGLTGSYLFVDENRFSNVGFSANYSKISQNTITGKVSISGQYTIFSTNNITNEAPSILTNNCLITANNISNAPYAIFPIYGNSNVFSNNVINHLSVGLWVQGSNNTIIKNQITHCGIALQPSANNTYYGNEIANNLWGVDTIGALLNPYGNSSTLYKNNMKDNTYQVNTIFNSKQDYFDNGKEGNYWSNYNGKDSDGDGIGDTHYIIDDNRLDRYPLIDPVNISAIPDSILDWSLAPSIEIINPINTNYPNGNITINYLIDKQPVWIGYSLDGTSNITINGNLTLTDLPSGIHNVTIYANDWYHNTGFSTAEFTVEQQSVDFGNPVIIEVIVVSIAIVCTVVGLLIFYKKRR